MNTLPLPFRLASIFSIGIGLTLLTTVAGTNFMVLFLLLTAPWAWASFKLEGAQRTQVLQFLGLIVVLCAWSMVPNLISGYGVTDVLKALLHDMRTFVFVVLLWPVFANPVVSRTALWALLGTVVLLATANLLLTLGVMCHQANIFGQQRRICMVRFWWVSFSYWLKCYWFVPACPGESFCQWGCCCCLYFLPVNVERVTCNWQGVLWSGLL